MRKNRRPINLEKLKEDDARNSEKHAFLPRTKCKNEICLLRQALSSKMCSQIFCSPFTEPSALAFPWHHFQPKNYSAEITLTLFQKKHMCFLFLDGIILQAYLMSWNMHGARSSYRTCAKYRGISNNVGSTCNPSSEGYFQVDSPLPVVNSPFAPPLPIDNRYL